MRRIRFDTLATQLDEVNRRAEDRHQQLLVEFDDSRRRAEQRHVQLLERGKASGRVFIATLTDIDRSIQRNTETIERNTQRLDDMGESIRANTRAVLSVLDRLEPSAG